MMAGHGRERPAQRDAFYARKIATDAQLWVNSNVRVPKLLLAVVVVGLSAAFALADAPQATANGGSSPTGQPSAAVTHNVSAAAQQTAEAFWASTLMADASSPPKGTPSAAVFGGAKTVGALFYTTGTKEHYCTASVVDSAARDLLITAAHCVYDAGYMTNIAYVPMYHGGIRPYGIWAVTSITVSSRWRSAQDPNYDVAFLTLAPHGSSQVQTVTGGLALTLNGSYSHPVAVIGYNDTQSSPVRCATRSFEFRAGQQEFYCYNFRDGTSGGPWITGYNPATGTGNVTGLIGGYEEGGNVDWASYSPYFNSAVGALYQQAQQAG